MNNLLITGSSGFIGSYCAKNFLKEKYNIFCISSKKSNDIDNKNFLKKTYNKKILGAFLKKNKINYVLLSHGSINHSEKFDNLYKDHFLFTKLVIENLNRRYLKKIIFLSSGDEYGLVNKLPINEDIVCRPLTNYALVKHITTNYLLYYFNDSTISIIVLRLFLIYGENQKIPRLLPLIKNNIKKNRTLYVNSLSQKKDFCHVSDLHNCLVKIFSSKKLIKDIYNFGSGHRLSIHQVIKIAEKKMNKKLIVKKIKSKKIKNSFSFYPRTLKLNKNFRFKNFKKMSTNLI